VRASTIDQVCRQANRSGHAVSRRSSWQQKISRVTSARARQVFKLARMPIPSRGARRRLRWPMEINPRALFERMFGEPGTPAERAATDGARIAVSSIFCRSRPASLQPRPRFNAIRARLGEYLDNVREIERRIQRAESHNTANVTTINAPIGIPDSFEEHIALMFDMPGGSVSGGSDPGVLVHDGARVERTGRIRKSASPSSTIRYRIMGNEPEKIAKVAVINNLPCAGCFARFLETLRSTPDGDGSLLDHALLFYGGGHGQFPISTPAGPLPMLAIGGGAGRGKPPPCRRRPARRWAIYG